MPTPIALLRLTRWREHIPFTLAATLLGVNLGPALPAAHDLVAALAANILAVTFAFMVNDLEDAPDDAHDPPRAARNPVTMGEITPRTGWAAAWITGLIALALFAVVNVRVLLTGGLTLGLGLLYSWRAVRLKAWPVVDVLAHALALSALLVLAGFLAGNIAPGAVWWAVLGAGLLSAHGQLYNQLRDYDADRAAGLRNSAGLLGRTGTRGLMALFLALSGAALAFTVLLGLWPVWVLILGAALAPLLWLLRASTDMRGSHAADPIARLQTGFFLLACTLLLVWLLSRWSAG